MFGRAFHHALEIDQVIPHLVTYLLTNANLESGFDLKTYNDETKNTGWVTGKSGKRYYIGYSHKNESIEIRRDSIQGEVLATIDNADDYRSIRSKLKNYI